MPHPSHDFPPDSAWCLNCTAHCMSVEAQYTCIPTTGEPPCDTEPATEPNWSRITAEVSGGCARDEVEL